jgi:hypothetical protein
VPEFGGAIDTGGRRAGPFRGLPGSLASRLARGRGASPSPSLPAAIEALPSLGMIWRNTKRGSMAIRSGACGLRISDRASRRLPVPPSFSVRPGLRAVPPHGPSTGGEIDPGWRAPAAPGLLSVSESGRDMLKMSNFC